MHVSPEAIRVLDNLIRADLESLRDWYSSWSLFSTKVVVFGCVAEVPEVLHEFWPEKVPERYVRPIKVIATIGLLGVILGVSGEWFFGDRVSRCEGILQDLNNILLTDTQLRTAEANERAATASLLAAEADERAGTFEREAARLRKEAEAEQIARLNLQKQIQPRSLSESDRELIADDLRKFSPSFAGRKVEISSYSADAEGMVFSLEINDVMTRAGIGVDPVMGRLVPVGGIFVGVNVTGPPADEAFIRTLLLDLRRVDPNGIAGDWKPSYSKVGVMVGVKPIVGVPALVWQHAP
jgi:hypothetical protein